MTPAPTPTGRLIALSLGPGDPERIPGLTIDWLYGPRRWACCADAVPTLRPLLEAVDLDLPSDLITLACPSDDDSRAWLTALAPLREALAEGDILFLVIGETARNTCVEQFTPHLDSEIIPVPASAPEPLITDAIRVPPNLA